MPDMSDLIQLVYASRSNLHSHSDPTEIEAGIGNILLEARRNNGPREIGGVLCFGDDFFFQCLEGERARAVSAGGSTFEPLEGRQLRKYVLLGPEAAEDPDALSAWLERSMDFVRNLPRRSRRRARGSEGRRHAK